MQWIDVAGIPGSGKSTICEPLWSYRKFRSGFDAYPAEWKEFIACVNRLISRMNQNKARDCMRLNSKAFSKMARVIRADSPKVFIQTAFAQRGLGIGWRIPYSDDIADFFRLMPVSVGVAFLDADNDTLRQRNLNRADNYSQMIIPMRRAMEIARDVLHKRGVPVLELNTTRPADDNRAKLLAFADSATKVTQ
jgi:hypothetical protein